MTMKKSMIRFVLMLFVAVLFSCETGEQNPFWNKGESFFEVQELFADERFPNVVVGTDGTVLATWGRENYRVRRSEDGGKTWGP